MTFAYYLCSRQGVYDPWSFQVEAAGVYLNKVYNWPMSLAPTIGELAWLAESKTSVRKRSYYELDLHKNLMVKD